MKVILGALGFTLLGAAFGAGAGWLGNPAPVAVSGDLGFVNYVGPIVGASVGATVGFIFGGGWVARTISRKEEGAPR
jgi:hypothetical protein